MSPSGHAQPVCISAAVEGDVDEAVIRRLVQEARGDLARVYGKRGKSHLDQRLPGYNRAARFHPWIVVRDLDHDAECGPALLRTLLPDPAHLIHLSIAVRAVEAWLLGDPERMASFLRVHVRHVPGSPELEDNPKRILTEIAAHSRSQQVQRALVPRPGSHRAVGPEYTSRMIEFALGPWRPAIAERACPSLLHCRRGIAKLIAGHP